MVHERVFVGQCFQAKKRRLTRGQSLDKTVHICAVQEIFRGIVPRVVDQIPFSLANTLRKQHNASWDASQSKASTVAVRNSSLRMFFQASVSASTFVLHASIVIEHASKFVLHD